MAHKQYFLLLFLTLIMLGNFASAQKSDKKKEDELNPYYPEGIVYSLPRTALHITIETQKSTYIPGPYAAYAKKYMGYSNVAQNESTTWKITGVQVIQGAEADPDATFKAMDSIASRVSLLHDGRIIGINNPAAKGSVETYASNFIVRDNIPLEVFPDISSDNFYHVSVNSTTGAEVIIPKNMEEKAHEAAEYIMMLRKKRAYTILSPTDAVPEDGKAYEVFVEEAQRLEKEYITLFTGKTFLSKHSFTFLYIPESKDVKNEVLFRFSEEKGIVPKNDVSGKPITIDINRDNKLFEKADKLKASENPNAAAWGVYYRIPVMCDISISNGLTTIYTLRIPIAQAGIIAPVPQILLNNRNVISFDSETGNIKSINRN